MWKPRDLERAVDHYELAVECATIMVDNDYGRLIRGGIARIGERLGALPRLTGRHSFASVIPATSARIATNAGA